MNSSMRGYRGKSSSSSERKSADLPENIGNRRTYEEMRIPPDNVGNMLDCDPIATFIHDGLGNSLEDEPSHLNSGILKHLIQGKKPQSPSRQQVASRDQKKEKPLLRPTPIKPRRENLQPVRIKEPKRIETVRNVPMETIPVDAADYMARLTKEFTKLLSEKSGLPFSFSMKPITEHLVDEEREQQNLRSIKTLIGDILKATDISATVSLERYRTSQHRFAVFFVNPKERDPARNKDLISALRQIVKVHASKFPPGQVNILLVLANAQTVIENHLEKLGARKV